MLIFNIFLRINLTINVAHPVFLMHIQTLLSGYVPAWDILLMSDLRDKDHEWILSLSGYISHNKRPECLTTETKILIQVTTHPVQFIQKAQALTEKVRFLDRLQHIQALSFNIHKEMG